MDGGDWGYILTGHEGFTSWEKFSVHEQRKIKKICPNQNVASYLNFFLMGLPSGVFLLGPLLTRDVIDIELDIMRIIMRIIRIASLSSKAKYKNIRAF